MVERDISDEVYHWVRQLEKSFGVNWPVAIQTIGFYRYPNAPPELKITIVEVTNPNIIVIDDSFEFTSMDMLEIKLKDMFHYIMNSMLLPLNKYFHFKM